MGQYALHIFGGGSGQDEQWSLLRRAAHAIEGEEERCQVHLVVEIHPADAEDDGALCR